MSALARISGRQAQTKSSCSITPQWPMSLSSIGSTLSEEEDPSSSSWVAVEELYYIGGNHTTYSMYICYGNSI